VLRDFIVIIEQRVIANTAVASLEEGGGGQTVSGENYWTTGDCQYCSGVTTGGRGRGQTVSGDTTQTFWWK